MWGRNGSLKQAKGDIFAIAFALYLTELNHASIAEQYVWEHSACYLSMHGYGSQPERLAPYQPCPVK